MFKSILFTVFSLLLISSISGLSVRRSSTIDRSVKRAVMDMELSIQTLRNLHSTFVTMADPAANAACISAISTASANINASCVTSGFLTTAGNLDLSAFNTKPIGPVCEAKLASAVAAKCIATFTAQYQLSVQICGANNSTNVVAALVLASGGANFFAGLTALVSFGQAICTKDGTTYCYDALNSAINALGGPGALSNLANINNTLATTICTACTKKLMNNLLAIGASSINAELAGTISALKFMCTVDPTNLSNQCMNSVALLAKFQGKTTPAEFSAIITASTQADINVLCSPCTSAVINNADSLTAFGIAPTTIAALKAAAPFLKGLCVKDGGDYCAYKLGGPLAAWAGALVKNTAALTGLATVCSAELQSQFQTCSAPCAAGISGVFSPFGCCLGVATNNGKDKEAFIAAIAASASANPTGAPGSVDLTATIVAAMRGCAITFPTSCAAPTGVPLTVTFALDNIKFSWATSANFQSNFTDAFKADVASAFGLDVSAITGVTITDNGKGSAKVTFTINTDVDIIAGLKATIQSRITTKTMAFGQTSALASQDNGAGKVDQASGVEASPSSTVDGGGASAAVASKNIMASIVLTALSLLAIKLF